LSREGSGFRREMKEARGKAVKSTNSKIKAIKWNLMILKM